jgi:protein-disulfide isomerase
MEEEKIIKYKKILIALSGLAVILLIFTVFYSNLPKKVFIRNDQPVNKIASQDDAKILKAQNSQLFSGANSAAIQALAPINKDDHYQGVLESPVQLIVYEDFNCPFCTQFQDTIKEIKKNFNDKVVIAFRHFPLITHSLAVSAAIASECAAEQGKFWEMHEKLYAENKTGNLNSDQFKLDAVDLKINTDQFNKCLDNQKYKDKIEAQMTSARTYGVTGTPTIFVNNQPLSGAYPYEDFTDSQGVKQSGAKTIITKILETGNLK